MGHVPLDIMMCVSREVAALCCVYLQPPAALAVYDRVAFNVGTQKQLDNALLDLITRSGNTYSITPEGYQVCSCRSNWTGSHQTCQWPPT